MAIKLTAQAQIMTFLHLMSALNIWPRRPRENKVEILTCFYITERSNLEDSSSYGGSDSGYRGGSSGYGGGGGRRVGGNRVGGSRAFRPSPVRVGEEYEVKIEARRKRGGNGVAREQGRGIFVAVTKG